MALDKKIILDTNIFINPASFCFFGRNAEEAFSNFLQQAMQNRTISLYMPVSVFDELSKFININSIDPGLVRSILRKSPKRYELPVPGLFLYELVEEMRYRTNKGLRIVEKYIYKAQHQPDLTPLVASSRQEYRVALREGIIDSREDIDLLLLARELKAFLATADNGLAKWADKLGISLLCTEDLKIFLGNQRVSRKKAAKKTKPA